MEKIRVAIVGLGNLGVACKQLLEKRAEEFELVAVFSRRVVEGTVPLDDIGKFKGKLDVVLVCVGSKDDAPQLVPKLAANFNTVDSFDNHGEMADYIRSIKPSGVSIVGTGWDPGLMSVVRMYFNALLPDAPTQSFWGPGVSMGHSNAIKQIDGVKNAIQFTVPVRKMMELSAKGIQIQSNEKHLRVCYVVANQSERARIKQTILDMPNYFAGQNVKVNFISQKVFDKKFRDRNEHEGAVISADENSTALFGLSLKSNALFTASAMIAYTIANFNLQKSGQRGVFTVADIAPKYLFRRDVLDLV